MTLKISTRLFTEYSCSLSSEDLFDPDLPLTHTRAHGGTLTFWLKSLDLYVTVISIASSSILPIVLELPGHQTSIHINIYLPTAGKEPQYMDELALLQATIENLGEV